MKVLLINDYGTPQGGAEVVTLHLRAGLRRRGHEVRLFSSSARDIDMPSEADVECAGATTSYRTLMQSANLTARRALDRELAAFRPDVVHVGLFLTQLSPLIMPALRDVPSVYYAHWLRAICPTGFKVLPDGATCRNKAGAACYRSRCVPLRDWLPLMAQMQMWRRWRGAFDRVVANSEATRAALAAEGFDNVSVIPCGVPPGERRPPLGGRPTVLFCGRLARQKGVHVLLEAWNTVVSRVPDARLLVAGDGPERGRLEQMAPPSVRLLGHIARAEMDGVAAAAWVQVLPSIGFEPFGLAAVEAMMRGTAVVASRVGGVPEVVEPEVTGKLVPPNDCDALADALSELLLDRMRCEELGANGRRAAEQRFSDDLYVDRFVAVYHALLAERGDAQ